MKKIKLFFRTCILLFRDFFSLLTEIDTADSGDGKTVLLPIIKKHKRKGKYYGKCTIEGKGVWIPISKKRYESHGKIHLFFQYVMGTYSKKVYLIRMIN
jgi:hypothetical protein